MPEPLTLDAFKQELATSEKRIVKEIHDDMEPHFTAIQSDLDTITNTLNDHTAILNEHTAILNDHTKRLERIENILWDGERINELERRVIKLAEIVGDASLATPLRRPIGT